MSRSLLFASILISLASLSLPLAVASEQQLSAYDVLRSYNFPAGVLPKGVIRYELDPSTGEFAAYLNGTCSFDIESYSLEYKSKITGVITRNKVSNLKGVSVEVLFFWLNIVEVVRSGNELQFSVGIASANFPVDNFLLSPQCGCGFDCGGLPSDHDDLVASS